MYGWKRFNCKSNRRGKLIFMYAERSDCWIPSDTWTDTHNGYS